MLKESKLHSFGELITIIAMNMIDIFKALSNDKRVEILQWLRAPEKHFDITNENVTIKSGV